MESRGLSIAGFVTGLILASFGVAQSSMLAAATGCIICWVAGRLYRA
jgi:hypothetical protein